MWRVRLGTLLTLRQHTQIAGTSKFGELHTLAMSQALRRVSSKSYRSAIAASFTSSSTLQHYHISSTCRFCTEAVKMRMTLISGIEPSNKPGQSPGCDLAAVSSLWSALKVASNEWRSSMIEIVDIDQKQATPYAFSLYAKRRRTQRDVERILFL